MVSENEILDNAANLLDHDDDYNFDDIELLDECSVENSMLEPLIEVDEGDQSLYDDFMRLKSYILSLGQMKNGDLMDLLGRV